MILELITDFNSNTFIDFINEKAVDAVALTVTSGIAAVVNAAKGWSVGGAEQSVA